jgi:hypothetical protein
LVRACEHEYEHEEEDEEEDEEDGRRGGGTRLPGAQAVGAGCGRQVRVWCCAVARGLA